MESLVAAIKDKKELRYLDDSYVEKIVLRFFSGNGKILKKLEEKNWNPKSKEFKEAVKEVRALLREVYGVFQKTTGEQRRKLLDRYFSARGKGEKLTALDNLFASHQSTAERREHFAEVYSELFSQTGEVKSVMDLGCGFNPMSYRWIPGVPKYFASDISSQDVELIEEFYEHEGIDGSVESCDLIEEEQRQAYFSKHKGVEMVWLLKLVDTVESQQRNVSKKILDEIVELVGPRWIVVSFPLVSIGGKKMREGGKENWFSRYLNNKDLSYELFIVGDEEFWIITL